MPELSSVLITGSGLRSSVVCCVTFSMGVGSVMAGEKFRAMMLVPFGDSTTGTIRCTPNEFFNEPLICLNLGTFISANDKINTKNAISKVAMSANVAIQAGAPTGGQSGQSSHFGQSSSPPAATTTSGVGSSTGATVSGFASGSGVFASVATCDSCVQLGCGFKFGAPFGVDKRDQDVSEHAGVTATLDEHHTFQNEFVVERLCGI